MAAPFEVAHATLRCTVHAALTGTTEHIPCQSLASARVQPVQLAEGECGRSGLQLAPLPLLCLTANISWSMCTNCIAWPSQLHGTTPGGRLQGVTTKHDARPQALCSCPPAPTRHGFAPPPPEITRVGGTWAPVLLRAHAAWSHRGAPHRPPRPTCVCPQEGHCKPGEVLFGTDSHTCNAGAFGQFATGVGNTDAGFILGTGKLLIKVRGGAWVRRNRLHCSSRRTWHRARGEARPHMLVLMGCPTSSPPPLRRSPPP